ncbi:hypothetical protein [Bacteroides ihuae]|uniref:hypothetical protein n=1 Tax=Bacteroides ihuae TaxID=1852362 RepID=UPI0013565EE1|nr:hypothetical protein [Bacteroides ihuae]
MKYIIVKVEYYTESGMQMVERNKDNPIYETDNLKLLRADLQSKFPCKNIYFTYYEL